jgi:hypothetical protein
MTLPHTDEVAPLIVDLARPESRVHGEVIRYRDWRETKLLAGARKS